MAIERGYWSTVAAASGFSDLQEFLTALDKDGDLARISAPVDPHLEVNAIVARVLREQGPALLFERPTRGSMPLAMNVFGTQRRMARALGVDSLDEVGERIAELLRPELPRGIGGLRDALGKVGQLRAAPPRRVHDRARPRGGLSRRRGRPRSCCPA